MRKDLLILLAVLIPGGIIALLFTNNFTSGKITNPFASPTPYPTIAAEIDSTEQLITMAPAASQNIEVLSPRVGDSVVSGFAVKGNARVFESNVAIRLSDAQGNVLVQTFTLANAPDAGQFGAFEKVLDFQTYSTEGILEVYQNSAKDGSEIDKVTMPILFN